LLGKELGISVGMKDEVGMSDGYTDGAGLGSSDGRSEG
jgi:hypothetical protein